MVDAVDFSCIDEKQELLKKHEIELITIRIAKKKARKHILQWFDYRRLCRQEDAYEEKISKLR